MTIEDKFTILKILEKEELEAEQISNILNVIDIYAESNKRKPYIFDDEKQEIFDVPKIEEKKVEKPKIEMKQTIL